METKTKLGQLYLYQTKKTLRQRLQEETKRSFYNKKGSIQQRNITLANIYAPNTGTPKHIKQILIDLKGGIDGNTIILEDFEVPLSAMDKTFRQKINKETLKLNHRFETTLTRHLQDIPYNSSRIYIFLKYI